MLYPKPRSWAVNRRERGEIGTQLRLISGHASVVKLSSDSSALNLYMLAQQAIPLTVIEFG